HVQTEFAFDIDEIANQRFAPVSYLRHVGLEVPTRQLALAFYQTYGLREDFTQTRHHRLNVRGYRWAVHRLFRGLPTPQRCCTATTNRPTSPRIPMCSGSSAK